MILGVAGVLFCFAAAEVVCGAGAIPSQDVPLPSDIVVTLVRQLDHGSFWTIVWKTVEAWGLGLVIAAAIGIPLGLMIGSVELLWRAARPTVELLRPVPSVALIPLTILLYGNGLKGNVLLTAFGSLWPLLIQAIYGVREVDEVARDTLRSYGLGRLARIRFLVIPSAMPFIATGMRIASAVALIVTVTSELVIGTPGLGNSLVLAENAGNARLMYAFILAAGVVGIVIHIVFTRVERRFLRWHPSQRQVEAIA